MKQINEVEKKNPDGKKALEPVLEFNTQKAINLKQMIDSIGRNEDFRPIVFGKNKGEFFVFNLEEKNGKYIIPKIEANTQEDNEIKEELSKQIMKKIRKTLKRDIQEVTKIALLRKEIKELKDFNDELRKKEFKPKLTNRVGSIFLDIGNKTIQIWGEKMLNDLIKVCLETGQFKEVLNNRIVCKIFNQDNTPKCEYLSNIKIGSYEKQKDEKYLCLKEYKVK